MEWFLASVMFFFASTFTITSLAIASVLFLVLVHGVILSYRVYVAPEQWVPAHARKNPRHP